MTTRIIKFENETNTWYEVQVLVLGFIWIDADVYKQGFPSYFFTLDHAMEYLDKLKKVKTKKTVVSKIKF